MKRFGHCHRLEVVGVLKGRLQCVWSLEGVRGQKIEFSHLFGKAIVDLLIWMPFSFLQSPLRYCSAGQLTFLGWCLVSVSLPPPWPPSQLRYRKKGQLHSWDLERCASSLLWEQILDNLQISSNASSSCSVLDTHAHICALMSSSVDICKSSLYEIL